MDQKTKLKRARRRYRLHAQLRDAGVKFSASKHTMYIQGGGTLPDDALKTVRELIGVYGYALQTEMS